MKKNPIFFLLFILAVLNPIAVYAGNYFYQADVKGMVCAFCAYSVSKNISTLPGVDADSVDVDLKAGHVQFYSSQPVDENKLAGVFADSGFTISNLRRTDAAQARTETAAEPALVLEVRPEWIDRAAGLLESLGDLAASTPSRLLISGPVENEAQLLKPILMGRQQVIKVRFSNTDRRDAEGGRLVIKLFDNNQP